MSIKFSELPSFGFLISFRESFKFSVLFSLIFCLPADLGDVKASVCSLLFSS